MKTVDVKTSRGSNPLLSVHCNNFVVHKIRKNSFFFLPKPFLTPDYTYLSGIVFLIYFSITYYLIDLKRRNVDWSHQSHNRTFYDPYYADSHR